MKKWMGLAIVIAIVLGVRLWAAFQTPFFTGDEAYFHLRISEQIQQGKIGDDELSYGGKPFVGSRLFETILAILAIIFPILLKIMPNVFAALTAIPAYLIAYKLTQKEWIAVFTALMASLVPAYFSSTFNHLTPLAITVPLFYFLIYAWLENRHKTFLAMLVLFAFLHSISITLILSIGAYIILSKIERIKLKTEKYELGLFAIFFTLWAQFIIFKKPILTYGLNVIWQNMPKEVLAGFYSNINFLDAFWQMGLVPVTGGMYALYKTAFKNKQKETRMMLAITIVFTLLLWLKLVDVKTGFIFLGITLAILFSQRIFFFEEYITQTRMAKYLPVIIGLMLLSALSTVVYPVYKETENQLKSTITQEEANALNWLGNNTAKDAVIIAPPEYGNYITAFAKRKNIIDSQYLMSPRTNERYEDVARLYRTQFETEAVELFDKYSAMYIVIPPGETDLKYAGGKCFNRIQSTNIIVYEKDKNCKVRVVG